MIGWYHSGPKLRASDLEINEVFKRFIPRPVMVIVDVRPQTVGIPTDAYFAVEEIKDVRLFSHSQIQFCQVDKRWVQRSIVRCSTVDGVSPRLPSLSALVVRHMIFTVCLEIVAGAAGIDVLEPLLWAR